jgi:hypothetical protein
VSQKPRDTLTSNPQNVQSDSARPTSSDLSTKASTVESKSTSMSKHRMSGIAPTRITTILAATEYPKLLEPDEDDLRMRKIRKCPCCCQTLPATMCENTKAWK